MTKDQRDAVDFFTHSNNTTSMQSSRHDATFRHKNGNSDKWTKKRDRDMGTTILVRDHDYVDMCSDDCHHHSRKYDDIRETINCILNKQLYMYEHKSHTHI